MQTRRSPTTKHYKYADVDLTLNKERALHRTTAQPDTQKSAPGPAPKTPRLSALTACTQKMKFDIKDDAAMALGALGAAACGAHALVAPKHYQDLYLEKKVPRSDHNIRWMGHATVLAAAVMAATIGEDRMTAKGRKDMFKVTGASWATVAGHQAYQLHQGNQKRDAMSGVQVALGTGIAALHLWKGFKKD